MSADDIWGWDSFEENLKLASDKRSGRLGKEDGGEVENKKKGGKKFLKKGRTCSLVIAAFGVMAPAEREISWFCAFEIQINRYL